MKRRKIGGEDMKIRYKEIKQYILKMVFRIVMFPYILYRNISY